MTPRPRVLVLLDWYLPGYRGGGPVRSCANMIAALRDRVDFAVLTADTDHGAASPYEGLESDRWTRAPDGTETYYLSRAARTRSTILREIREWEPDAIHLNSMFSAPFALAPLSALLLGSPPWRTILAPRGMLHPGALSLKPWKKAAFLRALRLSRIPRRVVFHATGEDEAEDIRRALGPGLEIRVAPNLPAPPSPRWRTLPKRPGELRVVFFSRVARKKNLRYLIERLGETEGRIELDVWGPPEDPVYWAECEEAIRKLPPSVRVRVRGPLSPAEAPAVLRESHLFALPTLGENFGHAIQEALGAGLPALLSDQTPWRGLEPRKTGWDLPLDRPDEFRRAIACALAMGQEEYDRWSRSAWERAGEAFRDPEPLRKNAALFRLPGEV